MKKKRAGDVVVTFRINASELLRTNQIEGQHPFETAAQVFAINMREFAADPTITGRSIVWNGVNAGEIKVSW